MEFLAPYISEVSLSFLTEDSMLRLTSAEGYILWVMPILLWRDPNNVAHCILYGLAYENGEPDGYKKIEWTILLDRPHKENIANVNEATLEEAKFLQTFTLVSPK